MLGVGIRVRKDAPRPQTLTFLLRADAGSYSFARRNSFDSISGWGLPTPLISRALLASQLHPQLHHLPSRILNHPSAQTREAIRSRGATTTTPNGAASRLTRRRRPCNGANVIPRRARPGLAGLAGSGPHRSCSLRERPLLLPTRVERAHSALRHPGR